MKERPAGLGSHTATEALYDKPNARPTSPKELSSSSDRRAAVYLADWLPPDFGAVGQYATLFSREMAEAGRQVHLIGLSSECASTGRELFEGGGLVTTRILSRPFNKHAHASRLAWAVRSNLRLIWEVFKDKNSYGAEVFFTGSPPFMLFFAFLTKVLRGTRLVYRITDFYPEVLFAAWGKRSGILRLFEAVTWYFRRHVDEFQVLGEDQRRLLLAGGIHPDRIVLKRDVCPVHVSGSEKPAARPAALLEKRVLLYSGNYGVAHELETIVQGLVWHHRRGSGRFGLWLNASGSAVKPMTERLIAEGIPFEHSEPVPLEKLPAVLASADAHLVSLRPNFSGYVLPSKIYACLSSRRPILYVGPKSSDVHLLCSRERSLQYEHVDAGDVEGFGLALERLADCEKVSSYV